MSLAKRLPGGAVALSAASADALAALGRALGGALKGEFGGGISLLIGLDGELGAGKTTLAAATLGALGVQSSITSPTYGLVHPYTFTPGRGMVVELLHVDLYRLHRLSELDELDLEDGFESMPEAACRVLLVEWFENARGRLGTPDLAFNLSHAHPGRRIRLRAHSTPGGRILRSLRKAAHPELLFHAT